MDTHILGPDDVVHVVVKNCVCVSFQAPLPERIWSTRSPIMFNKFNDAKLIQQHVQTN